MAPETIYWYNLIALLTALESLLGIINACLPLLKPVLRRIALYMWGGNKDAHKYTSPGRITRRWQISHMFDFTSKTSAGSQAMGILYGPWERIDDEAPLEVDQGGKKETDHLPDEE